MAVETDGTVIFGIGTLTVGFIIVGLVVVAVVEDDEDLCRDNERNREIINDKLHIDMNMIKIDKIKITIDNEDI